MSDEEESDGGKTSSPPASLKSKKKGTSKGKPKGKGKSSTLASNGQVSGYMEYILNANIAALHPHTCNSHTPFPRLLRLDLSNRSSQRRFAPHLKPDQGMMAREMATGWDLVLRIMMIHLPLVPAGTIPTQRLTLRYGLEDVMCTHISTLHIFDHADRSLC